MGRFARSHRSRSGKTTAAKGHDRVVYALWAASHHVVSRVWSRCHEAYCCAYAWRHYHVVPHGTDRLSTNLRDLEVELGSQTGSQARSQSVCGGGACLIG